MIVCDCIYVWLFQMVDVQQISEEIGGLRGGIIHREVVDADYYGREIHLARFCEQFPDVVGRDGVTSDDFVAAEAVSAVGGNITVYEVLYVINVVDKGVGAPGGDVDVYSVVFGCRQRVNCRGWDAVCLEAYKSTVNVEKQSFDHKLVNKTNVIIYFAVQSYSK